MTEVVKEILTNFSFCEKCLERFSLRSCTLLQGKQEKSCGSCLGILSDECFKDTVVKICGLFSKKQYESKDYSLAIKFPQSLSVRQRSMKAFEMQQDKNFITSKTKNSIKEEFRQRIISEVDKEIKKSHNSNSDLLVNVIFKYSKDEEEIQKLESILPKPSNKARKRKFMEKQRKMDASKTHPVTSIQTIENVLETINDNDINKYACCPPKQVEACCGIEVNACQGSIFFGGRYNKFSRTLSQTPWFIDGVRKTESSVQELICEKLLLHTSGTDVRFVSAGREDVDVRMLGQGRPFAVEIIDPRITQISKVKVTELQNEINTSTEKIAIQDLQIVSRYGLTILKQGEEEKVKHYRATLWCPNEIHDEDITKINNMKEFLIHQKTPIRVLHRRPCLTRPRMIHSINIQKGDHPHYTMDVQTQAGTYIKEFVHSDFGRTTPSLQSLLDVDIDIVELDVQEIELDWPPKQEKDN